MSLGATMSDLPVRRERPAAVTAIFLASLIFGLAFFVIYGLQIGEVRAGRDTSATLPQVIAAIVNMGVWCVGAIRLFQMKADAWIWMTAAVVFGLPLTILDIMGHRVQGHAIMWPIIADVVRYIVALGIIYYAYRFLNDPAEKN